MPTPQLLMLYNLRFHARTIRDHVEHLRKHGFVWWGRFYNGPTKFDATAARARWPHVAQLAAERTLSGEPSLLFATDFQSLHVFDVTQILLGDDPGQGARAAALPHYADKSVPLWFRVRDSRALSYDHSSTNDWLSGRLGPTIGGATRTNGEPFQHPYDPTGAVLNQFPIVLEGPAHAELFDGKGPKRWADAPDAMSPRPVQKALDHLDTSMDPAAWKRTSSEAREQIACAWVTRGYLARDEDVDPTDGFNHVARAVEIELRDELVDPLERLVAARKLKRLDDAIADARGTGARGERKSWTMGSIVGFVQSFATHHRRDLEALGLGELVKLSLNMKWLKETHALRNVTTHMDPRAAVDPRKEARRALFAFFERQGKDLGGILDARDAVRRVGGAGGPEGP
ncbi:MAG: hypothetical protein ACLQVI_17735 [Polyangiaceae bacterium]